MPRGTLANASASRIASPTKQRPMSMFGLDTTSVRELSNIQTPGEVSYSARPRADTGSTTTSVGSAGSGIRKPMAQVPEEQGRPPSIARTTSLRKPMSTKPPHSRNQSSSKPMPTVAEGGSNRNVTKRSPVEDTTYGAAAPKSRLPAGSLSRTNSTRHARTGSTTSTSSIPASSRLPGPPRPTSMLLPPGSRPNFSTLQQHYSPLKNRGPKPASSTLIHPLPPADNLGNLNLETSFLQTYLLQLSLLHSSFDPTYNAWCTSTRQTMRSRFTDVAARADITQERERGIRAARNRLALGIWGGGPDGALGENIQSLAGVLQELDVLCDAKTGRVADVLDSFGQWLDAVNELWELRTQAEEQGDADAAAQCVDGLGGHWRQEVATLIRRLAGLRNILDGLEVPQEGSSVGHVMIETSELIKGSIEELETVVQIEKMVEEREERWIDLQLQNITGVGLDEATAAGRLVV
ncbi:hypothetical protein BT63DRAFT_410571 [Microthyrium microscopicum]|uniref:Karyogamy protein n=1 Tax=Microthyrium microscopicum TaxID=703497 RepID=A0A6A6UQ59_9PEZI|nr:hypothetical protein BT63DRAFT_410571 [Microthyrium microscopicum]